jgi:Tol biopolymer transport system component
VKAGVAAIFALLLVPGCAESRGTGASDVRRTAEELLVFRVTTAARGPRYDLVLAQADGRVHCVIVGESRRPSLQPALFQRGSWAPDGRRIAFTLDRGRGRGRLSSPTDIYVADSNGSRLRRLTTSGVAFAPVWTPDGSAIVYAQRERGERFPLTSLWTMRFDGRSKRKLVAARQGQLDLPGSWSPDGRLLAFTQTRLEGAGLAFRSSIVSVRPDGSRLRMLVPDGADPAYSPDGRELAFVSDRDRNGELFYGDRAFFANELYVAAADGSRPRRITYTRALNERAPAWSPSGQLLAFQRGRVTENAEAMEVLVRARGGRARPILSDRRLRTWWALPAWRPAR